MLVGVWRIICILHWDSVGVRMRRMGRVGVLFSQCLSVSVCRGLCLASPVYSRF